MSESLEKAMEEIKEKAKRPRKPRLPKGAKVVSIEEVTEPTMDLSDPIVTAPGESLIDSVEKARKPKRKHGPRPKVKSSLKKKAKAKSAPKANSKPKKKKKKKATEAQLKAAAKRHEAINWPKAIAQFRKATHRNLHFEMGSPGSAQVTRVRLLGWSDFKGLTCFTRGAHLFISKDKIEIAVAAAKRAGKVPSRGRS